MDIQSPQARPLVIANAASYLVPHAPDHRRQPAMSSIVQSLKGALELQRAISGPFVPLGAPVGAGAPNGVSSASNDQSSDMSHLTEIDEIQDQAPDRAEASSPYERIAELVPEDSPLREMQTLEEIEDYLSENVLISIDETRKNPVMGGGDPTADLMVIGEAPGATEDATGEPFTGRAGQLLDKILAAIEFDRQDIYITNILKSRPPNNRNPLANEVEAHAPMLYRQIAIIKPRLLLCVGKTAGNTMLDCRKSLTSMRQQFHDFHGLPLMVTYHPAALLRNPNWKRPTWEDVKLLRSRYDELTMKAPS